MYLRYESGERTPSIHVIHIIADVLGTSAAYLTGESDESAPDSYLIRSNTDPELFHFIELYKKSDDKTQAKLLAHIIKEKN